MRIAQYLVVHDLDAVLADGTHRELGLGRETQLAHEDHVERDAERDRDLVGHGNPAAGKAQHDELVPRQVGELRRQAATGV